MGGLLLLLTPISHRVGRQAGRQTIASHIIGMYDWKASCPEWHSPRSAMPLDPLVHSCGCTGIDPRPDHTRQPRERDGRQHTVTASRASANVFTRSSTCRPVLHCIPTTLDYLRKVQASIERAHPTS